MIRILPVSRYVVRSLIQLFHKKSAPFCTVKSEIYNVEKYSLNKKLLNYISVKQTNTVENVISNKISPDFINTINNDQLSLIILNLSQYSNESDLKHAIKILDLECCQRLRKLKASEIILLMQNYVTSAPYFVKNLKFLTQALQKLTFSLEHLSTSNLIKIFYYAGWKKKTPESQQIIKYCLNKINNVNLEELKLEDIIIICNSTFKTSTKITQTKLLQEIIKRIYNQLNILNNESFFITIIKSLRHNFNYNEEILLTLSNTMTFNKTLQTYNFTALSHILTLYADSLYYDSILIKTINAYCIHHLKNTQIIKSEKHHFSSQLRLKDLSRYLWSLSYLGFEDLTEDDINNFVMPILFKYVDLGNIEDNIQEFVGIFLSLWALGYFPIDIMQKTLLEQFLVKARHRQNFASRLNLLLTCIKIEEPKISNLLKIRTDLSPKYDLNVQLEKRLHLTKIYRAVNSLAKKFEISSVKFSYLVPHLNILGITLYDGNKNIKACIECVDETNRTKYKEILPHGFMKLKLRLLKSFKKPLLVVSQEDIEHMNYSELVSYLDKKIKLSFFLNNR